MRKNWTVGWATTRTAILWAAFFLAVSEALHLALGGSLWIVTAVGAALVAAVWVADRRRLRRTGEWERPLPAEPPSNHPRQRTRLGAALFVICLLLLLPVIVAVVVTASVILNTYSFVALRWRAVRTGQRYYLLCSPRQGWHEFVSNNLAPILPPSVVPIWMNQSFGFLKGIEMWGIQYRGNGLPKPCLIEVTPFRIRAKTLHRQLLPWKPFGRKDPEVQYFLSKVIEDLLWH